MNIILIGYGGHAQVIIDIVQREQKHKIVGLIRYQESTNQESTNQESTKKEVSGVPVIGVDTDLPILSEKMNVNQGIICLGDNFVRQKARKRIIELLPNFSFVTVLHPDASISSRVRIGIGTVVMAGVTINPNCEIGDHCILNTNSSIDHNCKLCDFSSVGPGVNLGGNVSIGRLSHIGLGSAVKQNVAIGENSVIGGLSFVNKDVGNWELGFASPYRKVRNRTPGEKYL
jgi:sugar O-acyltransferase (sialic acid O-acetyltransferase NeuD family)